MPIPISLASKAASFLASELAKYMPRSQYGPEDNVFTDRQKEIINSPKGMYHPHTVDEMRHNYSYYEEPIPEEYITGLSRSRGSTKLVNPLFY